jgi:hypothetical protein
MAKDFAKRFICLSRESLASQVSAKLCFDHVEGGLDVRPFVVVLIEVLTIKTVQMKHFVPSVALANWLRILFEVNVGLHPFVLGNRKVGAIRVRFVSRDLRNIQNAWRWY